MTSKPTRAPDDAASGIFQKNSTAPQFPYNDLREWLVQAEKLGEVKTMKGLSWEREIGMVTEMVLRSDTAPCVVFDDVPGAPKGFRVLTNFFGGKRKNMTLGFGPDLDRLTLSEEFYNKRWKNLQTIPYEVVKEGPVLENIMEGDDIDVTKFPTPLWHDHDGGRYLGTGSYDVTIDPDSGWINQGTYRVMVHNKKQVGFYISPGKHGRIHRDKYEAMGKPMPVLIVCGGDPMTFLIGCNEAPLGVCEYDIVGGLRGKAMKCIKGKHTGLPFPADAEIVIEGFVQPGNRKMEGPFGEWTGYYASDTREEPILDIMRSTTATTRSSSGAPRSGRRTSSAGIAPFCARPCSATTSSRPAFPTFRRSGRMKSAARACWSLSRSSSATAVMPARPATSPASATSAPMPAST